MSPKLAGQVRNNSRRFALPQVRLNLYPSEVKSGYQGFEPSREPLSKTEPSAGTINGPNPTILFSRPIPTRSRLLPHQNRYPADTVA